MSTALSLNTQAILLLTAPLVAGRGDDESSEALTLGEYKKLARVLRDAPAATCRSACAGCV